MPSGSVKKLGTTRFGRDMVFAMPDDDQVPYVLQPLLRGEYYEERLLGHVRALGLRGGYVDVGAHLGTHTVWFAMQCDATHVFSFEPVERFATLLQRSVELNEVDDRVTVFRHGLGESEGVESNLLTSTHQQGFMSEPSATVETFDVRTLDSVVNERVVLMKLDVEGMEPAVLRGATRILTTDRPVIYAEARDDVERDALFAVLTPLGYRATGRVFNATPTYEFRVPASRWDTLIWAGRRFVGSRSRSRR